MPVTSAEIKCPDYNSIQSSLPFTKVIVSLQRCDESESNYDGSQLHLKSYRRLYV
jgi:hypothetical protein